MSDIVQLSQQNSGLIYDTISQQSSMICWNGLDHRFLMANQAFINETGFRSLEHIVHSEYEDQPTEGGKFYQQWLFQDNLVLHNEGEVRLLSYLEFSQASQRGLVFGIKKPAYSMSGEIIGFVNEFFDITNTGLANALPFILQQHNKNYNAYNEGAFTYVLSNQFQSKDKKVKLTERQSDCIFLLLKGFRSKEIATTLNISRRTVEIFITQLKAKLSAHSNSGLIANAVEQGLAGYIPSRFFKDPFSTVDSLL